MAKPDLIALAERISDGSPIDWETALRDTPEGDARAVMRNLRLLESLSSFHRTLASDPDEAVADATRTVVSGDEPAKGGARAPRPAPGPTFAWGPLEVRESLGEGGFGEVFRAWDPTLQREVALKLIKRESPLKSARARSDASPALGAKSARARSDALPALGGGGAGFAASVLHEARLLARVRHPNVVTVYGADTHDERVGLWMELVRGRSLGQWVAEHGRLGAREAAVLGVDLCRALAAVHGAGLVHRDVKAANVMREEGGRVLLMDFGAMSDAASGDEGTISGTPRYIAPEIYAGSKASPRSDLFSLGVLLYHLVTGRYPIDARTMGELREKIARRESRLLRDERPDLPEAFVQIVERALAWSPDERFLTAGAMEQALSGFLGSEWGASRPGTRESGPAGSTGNAAQGGAGNAAPGGAPAVGAGSAPRSRMPLLLGGAAALVALVALIVAVPKLMRGGAEPPAASVPGVAPPPASPAPPAVSGGAQPPAPPAHAVAPGSASSYTVEASLQRVRKDGTLERIDPGSRLRLGDQLALEIRGSVPLHVYVIDEDEKGHAYALFPLPGLGLEPRNPLPAATTHLLPGIDADRRPSYWSVTSVGGREHLLILASPERIVEFEAEMMNLPKPEPGVNAAAIPDEVMARIRTRGIGGLVRSTRPAPVPERATGLFEMAEKLAGASERVEGPWLRRIDLENPQTNAR